MREFFNFLILDNKGQDYKQLFLDIDKKIYQMSKRALFNAKYGLTDKVDYDVVDKLLIYKSILVAIIKESKCFSNYKLEDIVSRVKRLLNSGMLLEPDNNLTGCIDGECEPIMNLVVNFR